MEQSIIKQNRRLGMSVQEIYDKLDQLDRLKKAYADKQAECEGLHLAIMKSIGYNFTTSETYRRVASLSDNNLDKLEFLGKAAGLLEASRVLRDYVKGD